MPSRKAVPAKAQDSGRTRATVRIRVVTRADRAVWIRLRRRLWPHHSVRSLVAEADELLNSERDGSFWHGPMRATILLAELADGPIIGFVEVDLRPFADGCRSSPVGYLEGWYVEPNHRRKNVGRALVLAAENWARAKGCFEMASDARVENEVSAKAHRRIGYREVHRLVHFRRGLTPSIRRPSRPRKAARAGAPT